MVIFHSYVSLPEGKPDKSQLRLPGVVKSYNDRRGFGFLACTETADRFGRDVYMPKARPEGLLWGLNPWPEPWVEPWPKHG